MTQAADTSALACFLWLQDTVCHGGSWELEVIRVVEFIGIPFVSYIVCGILVQEALCSGS